MERNIAQHCIGSSCFVAGTPVLTDAGWRPIETIRPGERIFSRNPATGSTGYRRVTGSFTTHNAELVRVTARASEAAGGYVTFTGTGAHPAWSETCGSWTALGDLRRGERLATDTGPPATVVNAETMTLNAPATTYNFTVDEWHTYFVGASETQTGAFGVWVHNGQQAGCARKLAQLTNSWQANPNMARFRIGGDLADLKPHQKYLLASGSSPRRPRLDNIVAKIPPNYDLSADTWEGFVRVRLKSGEWISFRNGFPDLAEYAIEEVRITPSFVLGKPVAQALYEDMSRAWGACKCCPEEIVALKLTHTWHHTVDIANAKVRMQLVPRSVHGTKWGGPSHTGGFAVLRFLIQNGIPVP
jgi:hypothetical protein